MYVRRATSSPLQRLFLAFLLGFFGIVWLGIAGVSFVQLRRVASNPHVEGRIERTWITSGRRASRYADVSFTSSGPDGPIACRAPRLYIGRASTQASVGESLTLAPIPGSCAKPDIPRDAPPILLIGVAAVIGAAGAYGALRVAMSARLAPALA